MQSTVRSLVLTLALVAACDDDASSEPSDKGAPTGPSSGTPDTPDATVTELPSKGSVDAAQPSRPGRDAAVTPPAKDAETPVGKDAGSEPPPTSGANTTYGKQYSGGEFHLGPVDWDETKWHNACASENKYPQKVRQADGTMLAGVWAGLGKPESFCDACIDVSTAKGKHAVLRVVTYGDTTSNSIDVSPEAFKLLDSGEYPRNMTWQLTKCPDTGALMFEFKSGSNAWWTAFWVRNPRVPIKSVEVMGGMHGWAALTQASDASFVDDKGVGEGAFSIRVTAVDGQSVTSALSWAGAGLAGKLADGSGNFR